MTHSETLRFVLALAFCFSCTTDSGTPAAVDFRSDDDDDGVSALFDQCAEASDGPVGVDGCGASQDGDGDGVPTDEDLCPFTPAGAATDATGCASTEAPGSGLPPAPDAQATDPEEMPRSGDIDGGYETLVLRQGDAIPIVFRTFATNVDHRDDGSVAVTGPLLVESHGGALALTNADAVFSPDASGDYGSVAGTGGFGFPAFGLLEDTVSSERLEVEFGAALGSELERFEAPLLPQTLYLFFHFSTEYESSNGPVTFEAPGGTSATILYDPLDPFVFLEGDLLGLGELGPIEDAAIALSFNGLIPWFPLETYGVEAFMTPFDGHLFVKGEVPLGRLPLAVDGELVVDLNAGGRTASLLNGVEDPNLRIGANGVLNFTVDFLAFFEFSFQLGQGSATGYVTTNTARVYATGILDPDTSWLPPEIPIRESGTVRVVAHASDELSESYLIGDGAFRIDGAALSDLSVLRYGELELENGHVEIDRDGIRLRGVLTGDTELAGGLRIAGGGAVNATFSSDLRSFSVALRGDVNIAGQTLSGGEVVLSESGAAIHGMLHLPGGAVLLEGSLDATGLDLRGSTSVAFDVRGENRIVASVVNGAECGYETVTDGAICSYETVTNGVTCGFETVTDGAVCNYEFHTDPSCGVDFVESGAHCGFSTVTSRARCGFDTVTSGLHCGYTTITSALQCGEDIVTSAAQCGVDTVTSVAECGYSLICAFGICEAATCDVPRSCAVPRSCQVPSTCDVDRTCVVENSCNVPRTCRDLTRPLTCLDPSRPLTCLDPDRPLTCLDPNSPLECLVESIDDDFNFGRFEGRVDLQLGSAGFGGGVVGSFCPPDTPCVPIATGRVTSQPLACVDVPVFGEACVAL